MILYVQHSQNSGLNSGMILQRSPHTGIVQACRVNLSNTDAPVFPGVNLACVDDTRLDL